MPDVTVNIRGNATSRIDEEKQQRTSSPVPATREPNVVNSASVLRDNDSNTDRRGDGVANTPPRPSIPSNERMVEDVRREMQQRGVLLVPGSSSMTQIINQYGQATRATINESIEDKYNERRQDLDNRYATSAQVIEDNIKKKKKEWEEANPDLANDPWYSVPFEKSLKNERAVQYRKIDSYFDSENEKIDDDEKNEKDAAEKELTNALKELSEYFKRQAKDNPDSYIGRLREQQRNLIYQRDNAATEEGAASASRNLASVNEKLRNVLNGGDVVQGKSYQENSILKGAQSGIGMFSSLQGGDLAGGIMGAGSTIASLSGMAAKTALKFLGGAAIVAGITRGLGNAGKSYESLAGLAALRGASDERQGGNAAQYLNQNLPLKTQYGKGYTDYGLNTNEFASQAARRIKSRGTSDDWFKEVMSQIALERSYSLSEGELEKGAQYDRYGINITDAITQLVSVLSSIQGSGVSSYDFTRVQEKYDIQQQLMSSYMSRTDKPNYDVANANLAAFSSVKGITQDARIGSDYESFQDMILNPANDRMKTLVYSTVGDLIGSGSISEIEQALNDPENEGKFIQAIVQRIAKQYGDTNTELGYMTFRYLLPKIAPDRLKEYIPQIAAGDESAVGKMLKNGLDDSYKEGGKNFETVSQNKEMLVKQGAEYTTLITSFKQEVVSGINSVLGVLIGRGTANPNPTPASNTTKSGGNK